MAFIKKSNKRIRHGPCAGCCLGYFIAHAVSRALGNPRVGGAAVEIGAIVIWTWLRRHARRTSLNCDWFRSGESQRTHKYGRHDNRRRLPSRESWFQSFGKRTGRSEKPEFHKYLGVENEGECLRFGIFLSCGRRISRGRRLLFALGRRQTNFPALFGTFVDTLPFAGS